MGWFVGFQAICGAVVAGVVWIIAGSPEALASLAGALVVLLPNLIFATRLSRAQTPSLAVVWLSGQLLKMGLSVVGLVLIARLWPSVNWPSLLAGLAGTGLTIFLGPWFMARQEQQQHQKRIEELLDRVQQPKD
jgi:F0F1-type ATP synthase assembly protein I